MKDSTRAAESSNKRPDEKCTVSPRSNFGQTRTTSGRELHREAGAMDFMFGAERGEETTKVTTPWMNTTHFDFSP